jgi:glycosyltransferase involved in cell wall biosynthesis
MNSSVCLSIVICTYNRADLLPCCLESLAGQTLSTDLYEVVIVDNNSTDDTQLVATEFAGQFSNFMVVSEVRQGLSHARNRGWCESSGRYVAFIDDDAKAEPEWCERILHAFETVQPQPVAVGGEIYPWYECPPPEWFIDEFEIRSWGVTARFLSGQGASGGFSGSNMALQRKVLEESGGFSTKYGMVGGSLGLGEERDLFLRIYRGNPLFWYDPTIKVHHWTPRRNMSILYRMRRQYVAGIARFSREKSTLFSWEYLWAACFFIAQLIKLPMRLLFTRRNWQTELVFRLQELSWNAGFIVAGCRFGQPCKHL